MVLCRATSQFFRTVSSRALTSSTQRMISGAVNKNLSIRLPPARHTLASLPFRFFSTNTTEEVKVVEAEVVSETTNENVGVIPEYETTEDYFPSDKALRIRELVLEQLEQDETAHMLLRAIATTDENNLSKMHKIDGIMRAIGTSVLIDLTTPSEEGASSKMSIPYLGTERTAWNSFETVYKVISVADQTGALSEAKLKEWSCILRIMFETDEYVVRKASLSEESALALANAYRDYSLSTQFQEELSQELEEISVAKDRMNQSALALEVYDRQRVLMRVVSRFLDEIYSHFGYSGTEGFILMQKALNEHIQNADIVAALAEAGANVAHTAGLQQ